MHITTNDRAFSLSNIIELAENMLEHGWHETSHVAVIKGSKEVWNGHELFESLFSDVEDKDKKTYSIGGKKFTVNQILGALEEAHRERHAGKYPAVVGGRHRTAALVLLDALYPEKVPTPNTVEITKGKAEEFSASDNAMNDFVTRLSNRERLQAVITGRAAGRYKKEADLPYKRGMRQLLWAQSSLVSNYGINLDDAAELNKESARGCYNEEVVGKDGKKEKHTIVDKAKVAENVKAAIKDKAAGNKPKVMTGTEIRKAFDMAVAANAEHVVTKILGAIVNADSGLLEKLVIEALNK